MNEQSEPTMPTPYAEPESIDGDDTFCDAPYDDPGATEAVRFAGCSVKDELRLMEAIAS